MTEKKKPEFVRGCALALPSYSIKDKKMGESFFIEVLTEMSSKQQLKKDGTPDTDEEGNEKWIHHATVIDYVTGEQGEMVLPYIIKRAFDAVVARDKSLAGHSFEIAKGAKKNRTNEWTVYEITVKK